MLATNSIHAALLCPSCGSMVGYLYENLRAKCLSCGVEKDVFCLFNEALNSDKDSVLWSFAFRILATFKIAPIYESIISPGNITYRAFEIFEVDLTKLGLPENARILYLNFTQCGGKQMVVPSHLFGQGKCSIDDIAHKLRFFGVPLNLKGKSHEEIYEPDISFIDTTESLTASLFIRWCIRGG